MATRRSLSRRALLRRGLAAGALALGAGALATPPRRAGAARRPAAPDPDQIVRERVEAFMARGGTPGVAVALYADGQERYYSFGYADRAAQRPVTEDTLFSVGSVNKVFTATLFASQVVDPASPTPKRLTDPVAAYLPPPAAGALRQVTLQQLATHSSGMPDQAAGVARPGEVLFDDRPPAPDLLRWWATWQPTRPPGSRFEYSNVGFITLGYAVVGQPGPPAAPGYSMLLARTITEPLRMLVTANRVLVEPLLAGGYVKRGDALQLVNTRAANIHSSARDMLTWVRANLGLLDDAIPPTLAQALALTHNAYFSPPPDQQPRFDMGLGWQIHDRRADTPPLLVKNGATSLSGHSCVVALMPARQAGLAVLTNAFGSGLDPTGLGLQILRALTAQADLS